MIEETTAKAFEALLHFLYSDALEVEDELLVDVLRCFAHAWAEDMHGTHISNQLVVCAGWPIAAKLGGCTGCASPG